MTTADWALVVSIAAAAIALLAAAFAGWQALTAHRARMADNEGTLVEWAPAEWIAADIVEIRSNGPDEARRVWARLNIDGVRYVRKVRRIRPGDALRFEITDKQLAWDWHERNAPKVGEQHTPSTAFYYGGLITWYNRYGRRFPLPIEGAISRQVRLDPEPYPRAALDLEPS